MRSSFAVGDGIADDTAAIQAEIDWQLYRGKPGYSLKGGEVRLGEGIFRITDTLHLGYGDTYRTCALIGEGPRYRGEPVFAGTTIIADFNDRPAIAISGSRGSCVKNLSIVGKNGTWVTSNNLGTVTTPLVDDLISENWIDPNFPESSGAQHSPYCAIAIDPYGGPKPAVPYPAVAYPLWTGITTQYEKATSSAVVIEDVNITGFVVGVANQPADVDANGDYTKLNRVHIEQCQYGVSIGNGQSRLFQISNCAMAQVHTGIVTDKHGKQRGKCSVDVVSTEIGACINWFSMTSSDYGGSPSFTACYGEVVYRIGDTGKNASGQAPITLSNCELSFEGSWSVRGIPATVLKNGGHARTKIRECSLSIGNFPMSLNIESQNPTDNTVFDGCVITCNDGSSFPEYIRSAIRSTKHVMFGRAFNPHKFSAYCSDEKGGWWLSMNRIDPYATRAISARGDRGVFVPSPAIHVNTTTYKPKVVGRELSIDFPGWADWQFSQGFKEPGDILQDDSTGTIFVINSRVGTLIKATAMNNFDSSGNLKIQLSNSSNLYSKCSRFFVVSNAIMWGTAVLGSSRLENISRSDNYSGKYVCEQVSPGDWVVNFSGDREFVDMTRTNIIDVKPDSITFKGVLKFNGRNRLPIFMKPGATNA